MESRWNSTAHYDVFLKGLVNSIPERLLPLDLPPDLDSLIALAIRTDNRLVEFKALQGERPQKPRYLQPNTATSWTPSEWSSPDRSQTFPHIGEEEPMEMGRARLSQEEQQRRVKEGRCFYCGESGHLVSVCPAKSTRSSNQTSSSVPSARVLTPVQVKHNTTAVTMNVLIDSGADESLMDWGLDKRLGLKAKTLTSPIKASALNGNKPFTITHHRTCSPNHW